MGRSHASCIARSAEAQLVGIAEPTSLELSKELGVPQFYNCEQLIESVKPDAVIIATPNDTHVQTTTYAIESGVPCLLEKPVGLNLDEVTRLDTTIRQTGVPVLVGHHRRHHPLISAAKEAIASGILGDIVAVTAMWLTMKPEEYFDSWRRSPGAGVMLINLVHDLDTLRFLVGEIARIQAVTSNQVRGFEVEDTAGLLLQFETGAIGTIIGSDTATAPWGWDQNSDDDPQFAQQPDAPTYLIAGTKGSISIPQLDIWTYRNRSDWHTPLNRESLNRPHGGALDNQLNHFIDVARGLDAPIVSVADAGKSLAAVQAAQEAAKTGKATATPSRASLAP